MIFVFSEDEETAFEILARAKEAAGSEELVSISIGKDTAEEHIAHGADRVYSIDFSGVLQPDIVIENLTRLLEQQEPEIFLIGGTKTGKEIAARIAQLSGVGCATDCIDLSIEEGELNVKRLVLGGRFIAVQKFLHKPAVATVLPRSFEKRQDKTRKGEIIEVLMEPVVSKIKVLEIKNKVHQEVRLEEADIIVSAGRGVRKKEDLKLIRELAEVLGGAVGCSRSIAADLKWLPDDHWVGLSGHKVKPGLYIAIGVSGQVQHIAGIRDSKTIIAINNDPNAPIFKSCDYGLVGDLYEIVPELTEILKKRLNK